MKKEEKSFFNDLFGAEGRPSETEQSGRPVTITSYSQPHVLQQRMREEKMTHGQTVTASLSPVRLESNFGRVVLYFCPLISIKVLATTAAGDGGEIPRDAIVEGLNVKKDFMPGLYSLKNVQLTSNGTMQVTATKETYWELLSVE